MLSDISLRASGALFCDIVYGTLSGCCYDASFGKHLAQVKEKLQSIAPEIALAFKKLNVGDNNWAVSWQILKCKWHCNVKLIQYLGQAVKQVKRSHVRDQVAGISKNQIVLRCSEAAVSLCQINEQGLNFMRALVPRLAREMTSARQWRNPATCQFCLMLARMFKCQ